MGRHQRSYDLNGKELLSRSLACNSLTSRLGSRSHLKRRWDPRAYIRGCNQETGYRQTFQHDGENVSQIYIHNSSLGESIPAMGYVKSPRASIEFLWRKWPPGICIALLAGAAAIFPIVTPTQLTPVDKLKWSAGLGFLLVLELVIIFKERRAQDHAYIEQLKSIEEMRATTDARLTSLLRIAAASNDPVEGLKKRALQLSDSILEFVQNQVQETPEEPDFLQSYMQGIAHQPFVYVNTFGKSLKFQQDTVAFYKARFLTKVEAILREFARQGIVDDWLNTYFAVPAGNQIIRIIGERIGGLTERLTTTTPEDQGRTLDKA